MTRLRHAASALLALAALWYIFSFMFVALSSINYPFQLEWMEGQTIDILTRIHNGEPFYVAPSIEYVPFIYTPLYYYVAALVAQATVLDFFPARLLSILSTLGTASLLFAWVRREGGGRAESLITAGMFLATYMLSGRWFDVSRIDNLWMFLLLSGLFMSYHYRGLPSALAAVALLVAAFFTKQSALIAMAPALLAGLLFDRKRALIIGIGTLLGIGTGVAWFQQATDGWFGFYVFDVPAGHGLEERIWLDFWTIDITQKIGIFYALALSGVVWMWKSARARGIWYGALLLGFTLCVYASRLHWGGWLNVLIPLHVAAALLAGLSLVAVRHKPQVMALLASGLVAVQFGLLAYDPRTLIPSRDSVAQGQRFLDEIAMIDGDIFMAEIQFVQTRAGKKSFTYGMAGFDVLRSELGDKNIIREKLRGELRQAFEDHRFAAVISGRLLKLREKDPYYTFDRAIDYPQEYVTGAIPRTLTGLYVPRTE